MQDSGLPRDELAPGHRPDPGPFAAPEAPAEQPSRPAGAGPLEPVAEGERIHALDVLRGLAIFGIFMVNIAFFAMPLGEIIDWTALAEAPAGERASWSLVRAFFEFKFISLFSLLFGVGLVIQMRRAEQRGRPFVPMYLRRTFLLMAMGLIHGILIWYGDILFVYSIVALVALAMRLIRPRRALTVAAILIGVSVLLAAASATFQVGSVKSATPAGTTAGAADRTGSTDEDGEAGAGAAPASTDGEATDVAATGDRMERYWAALRRAFTSGGDPESEAEVIAWAEGPMAATIIHRSILFGLIVVIGGLFGFGWRVLGLFLVGMALMKLDFFDAARRPWQRRLAAIGLGLGVPGELAVVSYYYAADYQVLWANVGIESLHAVASLFLCFGYLGAATLIARSPAARLVTVPLACVGRLALTNYLGQSVITTSIMYWWGLGLFGQVSRPAQLGLVCAIFLGQVLLSMIWLRLFRIGPVEWLWRTLTYLRPPAVLRRSWLPDERAPA